MRRTSQLPRQRRRQPRASEEESWGASAAPPTQSPTSGHLDAIRHVYALMPLTEYVVTSLNRNRRLADLKDDIAEIGYPRS